MQLTAINRLRIFNFAATLHLARWSMKCIFSEVTIESQNKIQENELARKIMTSMRLVLVQILLHGIKSPLNTPYAPEIWSLHILGFRVNLGYAEKHDLGISYNPRCCW